MNRTTNDVLHSFCLLTSYFKFRAVRGSEKRRDADFPSMHTHTRACSHTLQFILHFLFSLRHWSCQSQCIFSASVLSLS